jgi:hypothetical protein
MSLHYEYPSGQYWFSSAKYQQCSVWLALTGPGRIAIQSVFPRPETHGRVRKTSRSTSYRW